MSKPKLRNVLAYDAHIDSTRYVARFGKRPDAERSKTEIFMIMDRKQIGFMLYYRGTYSALARHLARGFVGGSPRWIMYAPMQAAFGPNADSLPGVKQL